MNPSWAFSNGGLVASTDNPTPARNLYPTARGATLGTASGGETMVTTGPGNGDMVDASGAPSTTAPGVLGQPLTWWAAIIVAFVVLGMVAKRAGSEGEFGNIKASAYNILTITLAAIIGITGLKVLFTRFTVPGVSALIQAV